MRRTSAPSAGFHDTGDHTWRRRALCQEVDPELFFPIGNNEQALYQTDVAKAVCSRCPVMEHCRGWALETGQDTGVWGGMSENERRAAKRHAANNRPVVNA